MSNMRGKKTPAQANLKSRQRQSDKHNHRRGNNRENKLQEFKEQETDRSREIEKQTEGIKSLGHRYGERPRAREIEIESE